MFTSRKFNFVLLAAVVVVAMIAVASIGLSPVLADTSAVTASRVCTVDDAFDVIDPAWVTDRYEPKAFTSTFFDGDNRLEIEIHNDQASVNRGSQKSIFYNTQGRKMAVATSGEWTASADLYVSADMLTGNNLRRTDLWTRTGGPIEADASYHIIGIIRGSATDPWNPNAGDLQTNWRVWDSDDPNGWTILPGPTTTGWYELKMVGDATAVEFYIDGSLVHTDTTPNTVDPNLSDVYLQAYNFSNENQSNSGQDYSVYWDDLSLASDMDCAAVTFTAPDDLICGAPVEMTIDFSDVVDLYGYQFEVTYDHTKATANGAFVNSWFDTSAPSMVPPGWSADCNAGTCKFAASLQNPDPAVSTVAPATVAKITFTRSAAGSFTASVGNPVLTNLDGDPMPVDLLDAKFDFDVCGMASVSGKISLQGRATPMNFGWVKLIDTDGNFAPTSTTFNSSGNYTISNIPVMSGGSNYVIQATHYLYLGNEKALPLSPDNALTGQNTRLLGGDANNSGVFDNPLNLMGLNVADGVSVADVGCIGSDFAGAPNKCGDPLNQGPYYDDSSSDINNDGTVNIQDLSIAGGNFDKDPFQNW